MCGEQLNVDGLKAILEKLVGQRCNREECRLPESAVSALQKEGTGLGHSQLNELLLLLGFDRITYEFFQFLVDGSTEYQPGSALRSIEELRSAVDRFRRLGLLLFGNIKFAFKALSHIEGQLQLRLDQTEEIPLSWYQARHDPVLPIDPISPEDTYYLGYMIERELKEKLAANPSDRAALEQEEKRLAIVERGKRNQTAYLVSDHLDVYVATSMRRRHEYLAVNRLASEIFSHEDLKSLKLRWFDPTQAYCTNRIDKGLSEALMLRRAECTIYLAQESDTLGKDSELASTLAQGKTVIAFVPDPDAEYLERLLNDVASANKSCLVQQVLLDQLAIFDTSAAWTNKRIRTWLQNPSAMEVDEGKFELQRAMKKHYDGRATTLKKTHPLGVQVNLATGVANGVLVVRDIASCAKLIRRIMTRSMRFVLDEQSEAIYLREEISGCVYRVATSDIMLTNTFWNFYLDPSQ